MTVVLASRLPAERAAEPYVALVDVPDVGHAVADHHRPVDAETEGESAVAVRVDAAGDQHPRVDHSAAGDLYPALRAADPAGLAARPGGLTAADMTLHRHVGRRLGEREEVRAQPGLQSRPEHGLDERVDGPAQVGHRQ